MNLPQGGHARVDKTKVVEYLLSHDHPDGAPKARFFERFGFRLSDWAALAAALQDHGRLNPVVNVVETGYGTRYTVDGAIRSPDGRDPMIRTVWIAEPESKGPRLITAYPVAEPE